MLGDHTVAVGRLRKPPQIVKFLNSEVRSYTLDTSRADMFGENCTCVINLILVCWQGAMTE